MASTPWRAVGDHRPQRQWQDDPNAHPPQAHSSAVGTTSPLQQRRRTYRTNSRELPTSISQIYRHFPIHVHEVIDSGLPKETTEQSSRRARVEELAEAIGITHLLQQPIGKLSGGQLQRTLLGRALASDPELLILDEPLSFLDKSYKESFEALLEHVVRPETTMLMVTHDLHHATSEHWKTLTLGR